MAGEENDQTIFENIVPAYSITLNDTQLVEVILGLRIMAIIGRRRRRTKSLFLKRCAATLQRALKNRQITYLVISLAKCYFHEIFAKIEGE